MTLAPPKPATNLTPGYRLDRYELMCPIAQGGMASVWIARLQGKHGFERLVAIKTILPQFASDDRFQKMFLDEAHIASGIEHVNVAHILDLGEQHDVLYLVMEFVDGDSLSKLQRTTEKKGMKIPQGVLLRVMADACGGLHAAHDLRDKEGALLGVVHRDVSPQNILVSTKGIAKVIDFGIAKARDRVAGETGSGLLKGKIQYMPPEQALGKRVDRRADLWAVGAILYHLLSGKAPYEAANQLATLHLLTSGRPPLPLPSSVPQPIAKVVRRAMSHDPDKRFESAAELQRAIESAMIEAGMATTTSDVAAYLDEHLSDRREQRRAAIALALKAAADRMRMVELLKPPSNDSASGLMNVGARTPALTPAPFPRELSSPGAASEVPTVRPPRASANFNETPPPVDGLFASTPGILEVSNATLGSAAIASPITGVGNEPRRKRAAMFAFAGMGAALLILGAAIGIASRHGSTEVTGGNAAGGASAPARASSDSTGGKSEMTAGSTAQPPPEATSPPVVAIAPTADTSASVSPTAKAAPTIAPIAPVYTAKTIPTTAPTTSPTIAATTATTATTKKKKVDDGF